jgi:maleylpyruvate isomerase
MFTLYSYYRSTAAYRVRIALEYKGLHYSYKPVDLMRDGGEQHHDSYMKINPQQLVPSLVTAEGQVLTQSLAIIDYLEEVYPTPALLPYDPIAKANARAIAQAIACDTHPLNNSRVLKYLTHTLRIDDQAKQEWYAHWVNTTFTSLEQLLRADPSRGHYCVGDSVTVADLCLVAQVYNANRFKVDMTPYPNLMAINNHCITQEFFIAASPEQQPDYPATTN